MNGKGNGRGMAARLIEALGALPFKSILRNSIWS